jgi:hypothetical protein
MQNLWAEIRRRNLHRVTAGYAVVAWVLFQGAGVTVSLTENNDKKSDQTSIVPVSRAEKITGSTCFPCFSSAHAEAFGNLGPGGKPVRFMT